MGEEKNSERCPQGSANDSGKKNQAKCYCPCCYCPNCSVKKSIPDDEENMAVYETLRNEIISTQGMRTTLIVYMYTVYFAIVTFGIVTSAFLKIDNRLSFVISSFILIFFQSKIHRCVYTIARISAYIIAHFEKDREDINWEHANYIRCGTKKAKNKLIEYISSTGAPYLALLSLLGFIIEIEDIRHLGALDKVGIGMIFVFFIYLCFIRNDYDVSRKDKLKMVQFYRDYKKWDK